MRILFNGLLADNQSGTGRYITELARALASGKHAHDIVYTWPQNSAPPTSEMEDALVRQPATTPRRLYFEQFGALQLGKRMECNAAHFPASVGPRPGLIPFIVTVHDLCCFHHPEWFPLSRRFYFQRFMRAGIQNARHIIADSQATADDITAILGVPATRITTVPLGLNAEFQPASHEDQNQLRRRYCLPEQFFLFVGTIEPRKNLQRIINAWARIADKGPDLVIAGRLGWKVSPKALTTTIPRLVKHVHWLEHVPGEYLPALYSAATAFIWPSLMEGFGLPVLESMACGTPALTANSSSLPEVAGDAALLVNPLDETAIADGMRALIEDDSLREQLRKRGLKRAKQFTWETTARQTIAVYDRVAAEIGV